jgi:hypothetical protein
VEKIATLEKENAELRQQLAKLIELVAKLNDRIAELLPVAQRRQRKPSVPKPVSPLVVDADAQAAFDARPKAPEKPPKEENPKKKPAPTGRKALPAHLEVK